MYQNRCCMCGELFDHENKRAVICHKCAFPEEHAVVEAATTWWANCRAKAKFSSPDDFCPISPDLADLANAVVAQQEIPGLPSGSNKLTTG